MHIDTKHQLTVGQSKLAKGYFFWHTRLDAEIQFSSYMWTLKVTCLLMIQMRGKWHSKCISVHVPVKEKNAYIMYNYTAANTLVCTLIPTSIRKTFIDTQSTHSFALASGILATHLSTENIQLHTIYMIRSKHEKYTIFKHILSINTMQEQP